MQQNSNDRSRMLTILVIWMACFMAFQFFMPKGAPPPAEQQNILAAAQKLEAEGRQESPQVALADRVKKLEQAANEYQRYYEANKKSPEGIKARFQQINVYDYLARTEGARAGTRWYDQAETTLKNMETELHGKSGTVQVEEHGQVREVASQDLGTVATERLNSIRADRDQIRSKELTYRTLDALVKLTGANPAYSYALALFLVVVVLKVLTWPFQKKQHQYMMDMARVAPLVRDLQEKMKEQNRPPEEVQRRMMQIYKENNVNLAGGCLPMLVMAFVLFPVFWMVRDYEYQFTNASFLWIGSAFSQQVWWLADNLAQFDVPLFVIYMLSMVLMSLLQPKPADPQQAQQQKMMTFMMPAVFGVMMWMGKWSSAFLLYWLVLNLVSMYQSWVLLRQFGSPAAAAAAGGGGTVTMGGEDAPRKGLEPMKGGDRRRVNGGSNGRKAPAPSAAENAQVRVRRKGKRITPPGQATPESE